MLLRTGTRIERDIVERTRSVVTVATPHFGTPLASFFMTFLGRQLLEVLAALATSRGGRVGIGGARFSGRNDATTAGEFSRGMAGFTVVRGGLTYEAGIGGASFSFRPVDGRLCCVNQ